MPSVFSKDLLVSLNTRGEGCQGQKIGPVSRFFIMKRFLLIIGILYLIFLILSIIYKNPYKLYYIFGKKGAGKSTWMVKKMIRYLKRGWSVYTDMPDVNIFGVHIINAKDLETFTPRDNSALFLDEIGLTFDNRKFKSFPDGVNQWFKFQRKYHVVTYVNSQSFDVDLKVRSLIDRMFLMQSIGNVFAVVRPISREVTLTAPSAESESRIADILKFDRIWHWKIIYLPRYFKYFNSFSAPPRKEIPSTFISDGLKVVRGRNARKLLQELEDTHP